MSAIRLVNWEWFTNVVPVIGKAFQSIFAWQSKLLGILYPTRGAGGRDGGRRKEWGGRSEKRVREKGAKWGEREKGE